LPRNIFSAQEVERILLLCDIDDPIGLRDRAIIEVLYSTGIRRMEVIALKLYELSLERGVLLVRQGKGKKDRYVPIGERAIAWLQKYIEESRPQLAAEPDDMTVFLTASGEPFSRDHMTSNVKARIDAAKLGKTGACHLFRHTMATLMHENGADIRHIQEILGHVKLETTQIYTHVSIRTLQQVHASTHPAAMLGPSERPSSKALSPDAEALYSALESEAEDDDERA
jgi:integrase/recombinase XerD